MMCIFTTLLLVGSCHCLLDDGQTGELAAMATKIQQLEEEVAALKSGRLQQLEEEMAALKSGSIQQLEERLTAMESANVNSVPIAFTAGLKDTIAAVGSNQQIVFDHLITNLGSAYSPSHGHFTAPIAGAYVFYVVLQNTIGHSSSIRLVKNGESYGRLLADDAEIPVTSTLVMILHLVPGDEVWVQNEESYSDVEQISGSNWSGFSGHLIARD